MQFTLNIGTQYFRGKPSNVGAVRLDLAANVRRIDVETLAHHIERGGAFMPGAGGASSADWKSQQLFADDFDNDYYHDDPKKGIKKGQQLPNPMTITAALARMRDYNVYPCIWYETFSAKPEWSRFRIMVLLDQPVTDPETAQTVTRKLAGLYTLAQDDGSIIEYVDPSTKDLARLYFGTDKPVYYDAAAVTTLAAVLALPDPPKPRDQITQRPEIMRPSSVPDLEQHGFLQNHIAEILASIPAGTDRSTWIGVAAALKAEGFDFDTFHAWSRTGANYRNERDCLKAWNSIKEPIKVDGGKLIGMAKDNGWKADAADLTESYKKREARGSVNFEWNSVVEYDGEPTEPEQHDADDEQDQPADQPEQLESAAEPEQPAAPVDMLDAFLNEIQSERYKPIPTGISDIDRVLHGGFTRQQIIMLGAAPGVGKTAMAQWIFEGMAQRDGVICLYINLEMSREQILARSISRIAARQGFKIDNATVMQGYKWTPAQKAAVLAAVKEYRETIAGKMIYNPGKLKPGLDDILAYIEMAADRAEKAGLDAPVVVLDYLQLLTGEAREDTASVIKRAVAGFKSYAIKHNTIVFMIIAHNRKSNETGEISMESGRDTSAIEYSADLQLGLTFTKSMKRKDNKNPISPDELSAEDEKYITLRVIKGRQGGKKAFVDLYFDGETMTYKQIAKDYTPAPAQGVFEQNKRKPI